MREIYENENYKKFADNIILEGIRGSQAHGTYVPTHPDSVDDEDLMAIVAMPMSNYIGLHHFEVSEIKHGRYDLVVYDVKKFVGLLLKNNPNVMSLLWLGEAFYTKMTPVGKMLIQNRNLFVSKMAYNSFVGYAYSQLKRMTHFQAYEGYMGAKRKALVEKYGYDTKNASHLIRLMRMCIEYLNTGELIVMRPDANELIGIKYGEWTVDQVKEEAHRLFSIAEDAVKSSRLPDLPDYVGANRVCCEIILQKNGII